ncbi:phage antirepressor KilAC domain-containing protein [Acinetobacter sp. VNH17]|uniref:Phage antirepressor KilAC domain-containing protein n=1 Tax=Acinetobacter thutiue TaxID=2998078 RepID=A0ABT7WKQ4_9GAMM|nr:phage antirepressor KilAC domain-containing protein [Acinetobacter thutiue]MCY6411168.1 phage antirepressor KilAC domain-containing protein [Acinetobacter thutiue]MDN0013270.1 phage antirepressor KilAC domain-containing protein [Acinetobacter thutiue]
MNAPLKPIITISGKQLPIVEYMGNRVVTFAMIDEVHQRPEGTARKRFNDNRERFIEGEDYFKVCASEIRTHKICSISPKAHEDVILITESGYLMLTKSFTDDLAWQVQRQLVSSYFKVKELVQVFDPMKALSDPNALRGLLLGYSEKVIELEQKVEVMQPTIEAFDRIAKADGSFCLRDTANNLQMRQSDLIKWLQLNGWIYKRPGNTAWHGYSDKLQAGYLEHKTEVITRPDGSEKITEQVRVTPKGLTKLSKLLGNNND